MNKNRLFSLLSVLLIVSFLTATTTFAADAQPACPPPSASQTAQTPDGGEMLLDIALVRPISFAGLIVGSLAWIVATPFALMSEGGKGVEKISKSLVVDPAKYTFTRPVGEI